MRISLLHVLAVPALTLTSTFHPRQTNWTIGQTVQTSSGPVQGHSAPNATQVSEYLGIPYAVPPVGDLRFAAPQKYSSNQTNNGTSFVSFPIQRILFFRRGTDIKRDSHAQHQPSHQGSPPPTSQTQTSPPQAYTPSNS